jgi:hypothetical protein
MARKRAPGGGRKRSPHTPRAQLTIRMQEDMRDQLEAGAKKRNWTVTEELLWRLRGSFAREEEEKRDPVTRALCYLISQIADPAHPGVPGVGRDWHRNPFMFRAFKLGVAKLLDAIEPLGEVESPFTNFFAPDHPVGEVYKKPETVATYTVAGVLAALFHFYPKMLTQDLRESLKNAAKVAAPDSLWSMQVLGGLDDSFYSMARARHDLGIKEPEGSMAGIEGAKRALGFDEPKRDKS